MDPALELVLFSAFTLGVAAWIARRDALIGGFVFFFFLYVILALVGYGFFPLLSMALGLYLGPWVLERAILFLVASFGGFALAFGLLHPRMVRRGWIRVDYVAGLEMRLALFAGLVGFLSYMAAVFYRDYDAISYAAMPQMPDPAFAIGFKQLVVVNLVLWAFVRRHGRRGPERQIGVALLLLSLVLFYLIAAKAGNRTDLLALALGISTYEVWPYVTNRNGGLSLAILFSDRKRVTALGGVALVLGATVLASLRNYESRGSADYVRGLPTYARVLYNDYYTPAHMLFGAIGLDWVKPGEVVRSTLGNAFFLGRVIDAPYLQQNIGNALAPGSSSRSGSFGFYVLAEGFMFAGYWGFLYNALVPLLGLFLWRRLSTTTDDRANAFWAAFTAMFFANISRSQTVLLVRYLLFFGVPAAVFYTLITGARFRRASLP